MGEQTGQMLAKKTLRPPPLQNSRNIIQLSSYLKSTPGAFFARIRAYLLCACLIGACLLRARALLVAHGAGSGSGGRACSTGWGWRRTGWGGCTAGSGPRGCGRGTGRTSTPPRGRRRPSRSSSARGPRTPYAGAFRGGRGQAVVGGFAESRGA